MKKFNEWAGKINEEFKISKSSCNESNTNSSFEFKPKKFQDFADKLNINHEKEVPIDDINRIDLNRRAKLIKSIELLHYDDLEKFLKDWDFIKTHAEDKIIDSEDDLNVIRKS